jgi:hypothetical protein
MASTEVIHTGVRVALAFLLSEIPTLLEKERKKRSAWVRKWITKRNQPGASSMPTLVKELDSEDREFHRSPENVKPH